MNEDAINVISSAVTDDLPPHSPCLAFAYESSVLGCIDQSETRGPDVLPLKTPCVLQVSGWSVDDSSDVRSPVAKSQLEKSVVMDLMKDSLNPKVKPDVSLYMPENLKTMPRPLKQKGKRRFRKTLKRSKIGTGKMNDTTSRITETCHSVLKTHIETEFEQKLIKIFI